MLEYSGRVIHGQHLANTLGFPTANLDRRQWQRQKLNWKLGVYIGTVTGSGGRKYRAAFGLGPKERNQLPKIEAHLLDYKGPPLYGKPLTFQLTKYLRPYKKFPNLEALKRQIAADVKQASKIQL